MIIQYCGTCMLLVLNLQSIMLSPLVHTRSKSTVTFLKGHQVATWQVFSHQLSIIQRYLGDQEITTSDPDILFFLVFNKSKWDGICGEFSRLQHVIGEFIGVCGATCIAVRDRKRKISLPSFVSIRVLTLNLWIDTIFLSTDMEVLFQLKLY